VVAESPAEIIQAFASWGFTVTSIASLPDVDRQLEVLEALLRHDPEVGEEDYLNLLPQPEAAPRRPEIVFTFIGQAQPQGQEGGGFYAGWAVAPSREELNHFLQDMGFTVHGLMSLADVRDLREQMARVAAEEEPDETCYVDLTALAA